jgi:hypothetical protein
MSTEAKKELLAEFDAATATVKAKLAAGIQIVNHCFEATPAQRMEWLAYKFIQRGDKAQKPRVCNYKPHPPSAAVIAEYKIKAIAKTAKEYTPASELIPELKAFTKAR